VPPGRLLVCATPIGNLADVTERLRESLAAADLVFAEDTRRTAKLLTHLGLHVETVSLFVGNEQARTPQVVDAVAAGKTVALVSDAGMPTISDPGAAAIRAVRAAGHEVTVIPGPSAVSSALALSGFGGDRFAFEGFLPRRGRERTARLESIADEKRAVVLFASPNRLAADLADLAGHCGGDREVLVAREMTKLHEESWAGSLTMAADRWAEPVKGEVTLVLGPVDETPGSPSDAIARARQLVAAGVSLSEAAREVSGMTGVPKRKIYQALLDDQESS
jgi:16S rRNA (cytidine1402-2'-O)-methyltransferase